VRTHPLLAKLETFLKIAKGNVVYMDLATDAAKLVAQVNFANGIARLNATHLAVASTNGLSVFVYEIQADRGIEQVQRLHCEFWVDNLRVDARGKLLISGHPAGQLLEKVATTNHKYRLDQGRSEGLDAAERPRAPSWVAEWDGNAEGKLRPLYVGSEYGMSTSTVRDVEKGLGFVVGLYEKGILQFEE
jgi:arylesterase/paraoxonase